MWFFNCKKKKLNKNKDPKKELNYSELTVTFKEKFEKIYQIFYRLSKMESPPSWVRYFDVAFIYGDDIVRIYNGKVEIGELINEQIVEETPFKLNPVYYLIKNLEIKIHKLLKMYTEDETKGFSFKQDIDALKKLDLITGKIYKRLLFINRMKEFIIKAHRMKDVIYTDETGIKHKGYDLEKKFKAHYNEVSARITDLYLEVERPFVDKFYLLWKERKLNLENGKYFYIL